METVPSPLFKFYDERRWAERFMAGELLCRSVSYFRDLESEIRGDPNEGCSVFRPPDGLELNFPNRGTTERWPGSAMVSTVKQDEIFAFCMSTSCGAEVASQLGKTFVEIRDVPEFIKRVRAALPANATFFSRTVEYYDASNPPQERWALPEHIATAKQQSPTYVSQAEYRLIFSLTDALNFQNATYEIKSGPPVVQPRRESYPQYEIKAGDLSDICRLCEV